MEGFERSLRLIEPNELAKQPNSEIPKVIAINRPVTIIGRSIKADVKLCLAKEQNTISRRHAEIIVSADGSCHINDVGSLNGVFVNRLKITQARLSPGDLVQFGGAAGLAEGQRMLPSIAGNSNAILYQYVETKKGGGAAGTGNNSNKQQTINGGGGGGGSGGGGKKRERGEAGEEGKDVGGEGGGASDNKKNKTTTNGGVGNGGGIVRGRLLYADDAATAAVASMLAMKSHGGQERWGSQGSNGGGGSDLMTAKPPMMKLKSDLTVELPHDLPMLVQELQAVFQVLQMPSSHGLEGAAMAIQGLLKELAHTKFRQEEFESMSKEYIMVSQLQHQQQSEIESLTRQLQEAEHETLGANAKAERLQEMYDRAKHEAEGRSQAMDCLERELERLKAEKNEIEEKMANEGKARTKIENEAQANQKKMQEKIKSLEANVVELTRSKNSLQTQLDKAKSAKAKASDDITASNEGKVGSDPSSSSNLLKNLKSELGCACCAGGLLMDAGVLPCSHAFCFKCCHDYLARRGECPICREPIAEGIRPYRSTHLDTIVNMISEGFTGKEKMKWDEREAATRSFYENKGGERLVCYGQSKTKEEMEEEEQEFKQKKDIARRESEGGLRRKSFKMELEYKGNDDAENDGGEAGGGISPSQANKTSHICEGCLGKGHLYEECPYASGLPQDEEEEDEEEEEEEEEEDDD